MVSARGARLWSCALTAVPDKPTPAAPEPEAPLRRRSTTVSDQARDDPSLKAALFFGLASLMCSGELGRSEQASAKQGERVVAAHGPETCDNGAAGENATSGAW
jgi:hypothetical protein